MSEENISPGQELRWDLAESEIVEIVQGIEHRHLAQLVKQSKTLQRRVFHGYRPDHLPWALVPTMLARDAHGSPPKVIALLELWQESKHDLIDEVKRLPADNLRMGVIELLVRRGVDERRNIMWALRLDSRSEIQETLRQGLGQELSSETSALINEAHKEAQAELQN